jgi:uncharacterized membrane protein YqiK
MPHVDFSDVVRIVPAAFAALLFVLVCLKSVYLVGPTEVGLVNRRVGRKKTDPGNPISLAGEAGFQLDLLMPGIRFCLWPMNGVQKHAWVQVPSGQIGVVISQIGLPLEAGWKSGRYKHSFGQFTDIKAFLADGGQKGVQRQVLPPGTVVPIHPVAFLVLTASDVYGVPVIEEYARLARNGRLGVKSFGLEPDAFQLTKIPMDQVGIVQTHEGPPLPADAIACRLGGFADIEAIQEKKDSAIIEALLSSQNDKHNNFQDYQMFLDAGGCIGLQYDVLLCGEYALNPFLVSIEPAPMLVVEQGQVAVIKSYVGMATQDVSGDAFKFGMLVRPGRRGIWRESLRTGKYALNPHVFNPEIVPTSIMTLNWSKRNGDHGLDDDLNPIDAKSCEGFEFTIDLQVQIHIPDTRAPEVISSVGSVKKLVTEVMRPAVGNHFRDKVQSMQATQFIETRQKVQEVADAHIKTKLAEYGVECRGAYIQNVVLPQPLVDVLTQRELATQKVKMLDEEKKAEDCRVSMEAARGTADKQKDLAAAKVGIEIAQHIAEAKKKEADGAAYYTRTTGEADAAKITAVGKAEGAAFSSQKEALGSEATAMVNIVKAIADGKVQVMPQILVMGGGSSGLEGLAATLMGKLSGIASTASAPAVQSKNGSAPGMTS